MSTPSFQPILPSSSHRSLIEIIFVHSAAVVNVEDPQFGGTTTITVTMTKKNYLDPFGKLRTGKWSEAVALLAERIENENNRERKAAAYFAMRAANEAWGDYENALSAYEAALESDSVGAFQDCLISAKAGLEQ